MNRTIHLNRMKAAALLLLAGATGLPALADETSDAGMRIEADAVDHSGCKRDYAPAYLTGYRDGSDAWYAIYEWAVSYSNNNLSVTWLNMGANCCPEETVAWRAESEQGVLDLHAEINGDLCSCVCTYDVSAVFSGIDPGSHTLRLSRGKEYTDFEVNLQDGYEDVLVKVYGPEYPQDGRIAGENVVNSTCKNDSGQNNSPSQKMPSWNSEKTPLEWDLKYKDEALHLTWINVEGNCATQGFYTWMYAEKDAVLDFHIFETHEPGTPEADCMCQFDVESSFKIQPGTYRLRFHNPFNNHRVYEVTATFEEGFEAHYTGKGLADIVDMPQSANGMSINEGAVLHCAMEGSYLLEIVSTDGLAPIRLSAYGPTEVSLTTLPAGVYIARLTTLDGKTSTLRFRR